MAGPIPVGMSEVKTSKAVTDSLTAMGLGSCIGVCMYDPVRKIGGMAHVMLPESRSGRPGDDASPGKFANTAVPELLKRLEAIGAGKTALRAAIAGGAEVFSFGAKSPVLAIGSRNTEAVKVALEQAGIRIVAEDTGGSTGRTVGLDVGTGAVTVRMVGGQPVELACLGSSR